MLRSTLTKLLGGTSSSDMETPRPWRESSRTLRDVPDDASGGALAPRSKEEHNGDDDEQRHEDGAAVHHVAEEARHLHALLLGDRLHHEVGRVGDITVGAHRDGA